MSTPEPETINTRHTLSGKIQRVTPDQYALFQEYLEIVPDDAKPYEPGMFKPGKVGEFSATEPPTDAVAAAQERYDAVLAEGNAPNSKVAREAKAELEAAEAAAQEEVERAQEIIDNAEKVESPADSADTEGDAQ